MPIGGGGLISGVATAVKSVKPGAEVLGVEAAMYPSFTARLRGFAQRIGGQTIAEGIAVKAVGDLTFRTARPLIEDVLLVDEPYLEQAVALYATSGAGAAALAALLAYPDRFRGRRCGLILCGGNIDSRLLASVLTRELVRERRIVKFQVVGDDRPGLLATVTAVIGEAGGNIIEVVHNRMALEVPAKGAEFDVLVETRDGAHTDQIAATLRAHGYPPRIH